MEKITIPGLSVIEFEVPTIDGKTKVLKNHGLTKKMMLTLGEASAFDQENISIESMAQAFSLMEKFISEFFQISIEEVTASFSQDIISVVFVKACEAIEKRRKEATGGKDTETPIQGQN
jgi:hypothetical protein